MSTSELQEIYEGKIRFEFYSSQKQQTVQVEFPMDILKFNIELLNNNHDEPYPIPSEIIDSEYAFEVMRQFLEAHAYSPKSFKVTKPITSKNYHELVDEATFKVCSQFTSIGNAQQATQVINLCLFIRFHQLKDAVCAAIATNYYIRPNDQHQLSQFKKTHKIEISSEETCQIIKQYEDFFNIIETKAKEDFLKAEQQLNPTNP